MKLTGRDFGGTLLSLGFWALLVTAWAGYTGRPAWVAVPLCVAVLSVESLQIYSNLWSRAKNVGAEDVWWQTVALSTFNSVGAGSAAFILGIAVYWVFG